MPCGDVQISTGVLRALMVADWGYDPGRLDRSTLLDEIDDGEAGRLMVVATVERAFSVEFPADLVSAVETLDDLIHYTELKVSQRCCS